MRSTVILRNRAGSKRVAHAAGWHRRIRMRILVTFALENEFAPWRAMRKFRAEEWGPADCSRHARLVAPMWASS